MLFILFLFLFLLSWIVHPHFDPVDSPSGVLAISQCSNEVVIFFVQLVTIRAYGFCSIFADGKDWRRRWQTSLIIEYLP